MRGRKDGFSLVEMLIVMAILGIIVGGISQMVVSSFKISSLVQTQSEQLVALKDATGYIGDQIRSATQIYGEDITVVNTGYKFALRINGTECNSSANLPCFAITQVNSDLSGVVRVFRVKQRSQSWTGTQGFFPINNWADTNTYVIEEYLYSCTTACTVPIVTSVAGGLETTLSVPSNCTVSGAASACWSLVTDMLDLTNVSNPVQTIRNTSGTIFGISIQVRSVGYLNGRPVYVPSSGVYTTIVKARNIPNTSSTY